LVLRVNPVTLFEAEIAGSQDAVLYPATPTPSVPVAMPVSPTVIPEPEAVPMMAEGKLLAPGLLNENAGPAAVSVTFTTPAGAFAAPFQVNGSATAVVCMVPSGNLKPPALLWITPATESG
jgi:hypothetical protein